MNKIEETAKRTAKEISENKISLKDVTYMACELCAEIKTGEQYK